MVRKEREESDDCGEGIGIIEEKLEITR